MRTVIVVGLVSVLLAGCASTTSRGESPATAAPAGCPRANAIGPGVTDYAARPLLPDDVEPVGLVRCEVTFETDSTGRWQVAVESHAASGWEPVVAALRLGDETRPVWELASQVCTLALVGLPWTAMVLEDGSWMQVGAPVTTCGDPLPAVIAALEGVSWEEVSRTRDLQVGTPDQLELEAEAESLGCATAWKDMITVVAGDPVREPQDPLLPAGTRKAVACRYSVAAPGEDGQFIGGTRLTVKRTSAVLAGLSAAVADPGGCAVAGEGFLLLYGDRGGIVTIELGGCSRALGESGGLAQVPASVVQGIDIAAS